MTLEIPDDIAKRLVEWFKEVEEMEAANEGYSAGMWDESIWLKIEIQRKLSTETGKTSA